MIVIDFRSPVVQESRQREWRATPPAFRGKRNTLRVLQSQAPGWRIREILSEGRESENDNKTSPRKTKYCV